MEHFKSMVGSMIAVFDGVATLMEDPSDPCAKAAIESAKLHLGEIAPRYWKLRAESNGESHHNLARRMKTRIMGVTSP
jgi:hypothetical protein